MDVYKHCKNYNHCSVNDCPLTDNFVSIPGDLETECSVSLTYRKQLADSFNSPNYLTKREKKRVHLSRIRKKSWSKMTDESRNAVKMNLKRIKTLK